MRESLSEPVVGPADVRPAQGGAVAEILDADLLIGERAPLSAFTN